MTSASLLLRLTYDAGFVAVSDCLFTRAVGNEVRCVGMFDRSAGCVVELARLRVGEIVRCECGCRSEERDGSDGCKRNLFEHMDSLFG